MKNDRDENLVSITCCLFVDCYGIEFAQATWTCSDIHRPCRTVIGIRFWWMNTNKFQRATRSYSTECTKFCVFFARFLIAHAFLVLRVGFAFISWVIRLSHKKNKWFVYQFATPNRFFDDELVSHRIRFCISTMAGGNMHSVLIPDSWCCWRRRSTFRQTMNQTDLKEIELLNWVYAAICRWNSIRPPVEWSRFFES